MVNLNPDMLACHEMIEQYLRDTDLGKTISYYQQYLVAFYKPVPWEEMKLLEYPEIVKNPMDFSTVKDKIATGKYADAKAFEEDVNLIW